MLGKHRLMVYLFLVIISISGIRVLTLSASASETAPRLVVASINAEPYKVALPVVMGTYGEAAEATFDLSVERIELTQGVQDDANSIPLVGSRQAVARVYIRTDSHVNLDGIRVSLMATVRGEALPNSPLVSAPGTVYVAFSRGILATSYNFELPASWLEKGQIVLTAIVDTDDTVPETDETNNSLAVSFTFTTVPLLDLVIVPVRYTHSPTGVTYAPPVDTISSIIYRLYPVPTMTVALDQPLSFTGDLALSTAWKDLLEDIANLRTFDNAPASRAYYGLVPTGLGSAAWFNGGYAGLGYVGWRVAVGLQLEDPKWGPDAGGYIAAHEIGHNLNSLHAPGCGASNVDPAWPWQNDGHIHEYGLDLGTMMLKMPTSEDVMGYCRDGGFWISSYTYRNLMSDQQLHGVARISSIPQEMLFIRATLDEDDKVTLRPLYHLVAEPSPPPAVSDYSVQLIDAKGSELARYPVEVKTAYGSDYSFRTISALVPLPAGEPSELRLLKGNTLLAKRLLQSSAVVSSALQVAQADNRVHLSWSSGGPPALVRYTNDNGASWTTLGFDLNAGELIVDPDKLAAGGYFEVSFADTTQPVRLVNKVK